MPLAFGKAKGREWPAKQLDRLLPAVFRSLFLAHCKLCYHPHIHDIVPADAFETHWSVDEDSVTFAYTDTKAGMQKLMSLKPFEFVRRFLQQVYGRARRGDRAVPDIHARRLPRTTFGVVALGTCDDVRSKPALADGGSIFTGSPHARLACLSHAHCPILDWVNRLKIPSQ